MKKSMTLGMEILLAVSLLSACGGGKKETVPDVDLTAFYNEKEAEYGWDVGYMTDVEGEMLENYYPGLGEISTKQLVVKAPLMSAVVNEMVFMQCETEADADKAQEILQARIDYQVGDEQNPGGAWYPESIEAWKRAEIVRQGTYVALIASNERQQELADAFNALFA